MSGRARSQKRPRVEALPREPDGPEAWGKWSDDEERAALQRFEDLVEGHHCDPYSLTPYNYHPLVDAFFDGESEGELPTGALVKAALSYLEGVGINGQPTRAYVMAQALGRLGPPGAAEEIDLTDFTHAGLIPPRVYRQLPGPLARCCSYFEPHHERDVFLIGALACVMTAAHRTFFRYHHKWRGAGAFLCIVAKSGSGKGVMVEARKLLQPLHDHLLNASDQEINEWDDAQKDEELKGLFGRERPEYKRAFFAGDTSSSELVLGLNANGGTGLMFESEIATLLDTMRQEWAGYRSKLLALAENEPVQQQRRGKRPVEVRAPTFSLAVSGTERAFAEWIRDTEDGLFNRTAFYTFAGSDDFESGWDEGHDEHLDADLAVCGRHLEGLFRAINDREAVDTEGRRSQRWLVVRFTADQQRRQFEAFRAQKRAMLALGHGLVADYTHRVAVLALRLAAGLTVFRRHVEGADLSDRTASVECDERDFQTGILLAHTLLAHGFQLALRLPRPTTGLADPRRSGHRAFLDAITAEFRDDDGNDREFKRAEAQVVAKRIGIATRTADGYLSQLARTGFLHQRQPGVYHRMPLAPHVLTPSDERKMFGAPEPIGYVSPSLVGDPEAAEEAAHIQEPPPVTMGDEAPF